MAEPKRQPLSVVPSVDGEVELAARADDELMLLARGGRAEAFDALVRRHQARALDVAAKFLGSPAVARDAAQAAFVELYRALPRYRANGAFTAFWTRVLLNQCRMAARARGTERRHLDGFAQEPRPVAPLPDERLLATERQRDVQRALARVSEKLRAVVVLRFAGDLSLSEIATALDLPVGTVKSRLFAGLAQLRALLEETP